MRAPRLHVGTTDMKRSAAAKSKTLTRRRIRHDKYASTRGTKSA